MTQPPGGRVGGGDWRHCARTGYRTVPRRLTGLQPHLQADDSAPLELVGHLQDTYQEFQRKLSEQYAR
eukprot:365404-Chlamydomonas_euryale.AAC.3